MMSVQVPASHNSPRFAAIKHWSIKQAARDALRPDNASEDVFIVADSAAQEAAEATLAHNNLLRIVAQYITSPSQLSAEDARAITAAFGTGPVQRRDRWLREFFKEGIINPDDQRVDCSSEAEPIIARRDAFANFDAPTLGELALLAARKITGLPLARVEDARFYFFRGGHFKTVSLQDVNDQ